MGLKFNPFIFDGLDASSSGNVAYSTYTPSVFGGGSAGVDIEFARYRIINNTVELEIKFLVTQSGSGVADVEIEIPAGRHSNIPDPIFPCGTFTITDATLTPTLTGSVLFGSTNDTIKLGFTPVSGSDLIADSIFFIRAMVSVEA